MPYERAVEESGVLTTLSAFDPHVAGTLPLGIDIATSDIDILCHCVDPIVFTDIVVSAFGGASRFDIAQRRSGTRAVVARFFLLEWDFEIFAEAIPVACQPGWRHFVIERRLLALGGARLRDAIIALKQAGLKTEPAFARVLALEGDPYEAMLDLEPVTDEALRERLRSAGF